MGPIKKPFRVDGTEIEKGALKQTISDSRIKAFRSGKPRRQNPDLLVCLSKVKGHTWSRHGDFVVEEMERCLFDRNPDGSGYFCCFYLCPRCGIGNRARLAAKYTKMVKKMIDEAGAEYVHTLTVTGPVVNEMDVVGELKLFNDTIQRIMEQELPNCRAWGECELAPRLREVKFSSFGEFLAEDTPDEVPTDNPDDLDQGSEEVASLMDILRAKYRVKPNRWISKQKAWFDVERFELGGIQYTNYLPPDLTTDLMIHLHCVIMHPEITKDEIEAVFKKHFPHHKAVQAEPFTVNPAGEYEINGWLRYSTDKSGGCKGMRRHLVDWSNWEVALPGQIQGQLIDAYARISKAADTTARKSRRELRFEYRTKKWKPVKRQKRTSAPNTRPAATGHRVQTGMTTVNLDSSS